MRLVVFHSVEVPRSWRFPFDLGMDCVMLPIIVYCYYYQIVCWLAELINATKDVQAFHLYVALGLTPIDVPAQTFSQPFSSP